MTLDVVFGDMLEGEGHRRCGKIILKEILRGVLRDQLAQAFHFTMEETEVQTPAHGYRAGCVAWDKNLYLFWF
jgi:hypothetical protein